MTPERGLWWTRAFIALGMITSVLLHCSIN